MENQITTYNYLVGKISRAMARVTKAADSRLVTLAIDRELSRMGVQEVAMRVREEKEVSEDQFRSLVKVLFHIEQKLGREPSSVLSRVRDRMAA